MTPLRGSPRPDRHNAQVFRVNDRLVVASVSKVYDGALVEDGWTRVLDALSCPGPWAELPGDSRWSRHMGAAVREALAHRGTPADRAGFTPGRNPSSAALGFATDNKMPREQVALATVRLRGEDWRIVPLVNEGPGRGFGATSTAPVFGHTGPLTDAELGAAVLAALDAADRGD